MLHIECQGCRASAYVDCACQGLGHDPAAAGAHHPGCPLADVGASVACPDGSGCCDGSGHPGASHDQAASDSGPCRPVTITVMPGSTVLQAAG